jgi:hypothetical protein
MLKPQGKFFYRSLLFAGLVFAACNIFNPDGEGGLPESSKGMVSVGQSRLKNQDWDGAMAAFASAIKEDSTNSLAYYSYAKAVRFKYDLNGLSLSAELADTIGGNIPFLNIDNTTATNYLQATARMHPVLQKLAERDSLTRWFNYRKDPVKAGQRDDKAAFRINFINNYLDSANLGFSHYYQEYEFPLSDGAINFEKIMPDLTLVLLVHTFMDLKDLNGDTLINDDDDLNLVTDIMAALDIGDVGENLANIMGGIVTGDSAQQKAEDFNTVLDKFSQGADNIADVIGSIQFDKGGSPGECDSADCSSSGAELTSDIQATLHSIGETSKFWRMADSIDNDGDGCVDEEIYDSKDNDGDGIVDEDIRLGPAYIVTDPATGFIISQTMLESFIKFDSSGITPVRVNESTGQLDFTEAAEFWAAEIRNEDRLNVLRIIENQKPPYVLDEAELNYAINSIKGCWQKFYNE